MASGSATSADYCVCSSGACSTDLSSGSTSAACSQRHMRGPATGIVVDSANSRLIVALPNGANSDSILAFVTSSTITYFCGSSTGSLGGTQDCTASMSVLTFTHTALIYTACMHAQ